VTIEQRSIPADPRDRKKFVFHRTLFRRALVGTLRVVLRGVLKIETEGLENLPLEGAIILVSNHLTNYDVFPMQMMIQRPLFFMAKAELHHNPILDAAFRSLGAFPVYRGQRDEWAIRHAFRVLEHGQVLALFPEGTRSKGKGLKSGKTGAARMALQTGCPIVPLGVSGTHQMFKRFPRRTLIKMRMGPPLHPLQDESTLGLTDRLMFAIADLLPAELRGVYSQRPVGFTED
jgi:1-acyl-sn-glycerol-3-phosphate acyltransferase